MTKQLIPLLVGQIALISLVHAQVRLTSDPSTPGVSTGNVVVADFNGDGKLDVAVPNFNGDTLTVKLGQGNGFFRPVFEQPSNEAGYVFSGDFNHDGKPDLIALSKVATVGVSLGNGDGTFQPQVLTSLPFSADEAAVGDLNGDGIPDLVITNANNILLPLLGNANGTFTIAPEVDVVGGFGCQDVLIGDFNNDGHSDVVATCNGTQIFFGKGNGTFSAPQTISTTGGLLAAADLNKDGNLDLAISYNFTVTVYLNSGSGTFTQAFQTSSTIDGSISFGDVNGDGNLDLLAVGTLGVSVELGNGNGTFQQNVSKYSASGMFPHQALVGDFNGDGIADILVGAQDAVGVLVGVGGGNFLEPAAPNLGPGGYTAIAAAADFNHDGLSDVVYFAPSGPNLGRVQVKVAFSNGDGTFSPTSEVVAQDGYGISPFHVVVGDLNHDGNPDILYTSSDMHLVTALSKADGTFQPAVTVSRMVGNAALGTVVSDFNGDGNLDVAVLVSGVNPTGASYIGVNIFSGKGDGTVDPPTFIALKPGISDYSSIVTGDFNGDGHPDIAVVANNILIVLRNAGNGTFQTTARIPLNYAYSLAAGDINQDGFTDLVVAASTDGGEIGVAVVFLSNGDGTFSESNYEIGVSAQAVTVADLNGDGYPEVLTENQQSQDISVLDNNKGTLSYGGSWYSVSETPVPILVGHFVSATPLAVLDTYNLLGVRTQ